MGRVRWSWHRILAAAAVISATAVVNANAASSPALPQLHAADVADAYVDALAPATNFGAAPVLRT
jgi:hypothetical protein